MPKVELRQIVLAAFLQQKLEILSKGLRYCLHLGPLGIIQLFLSGHLTKKSSNVWEADGSSNIYLAARARNLGVILNPPILLASPPKHVFLLPPP